MRTFRARRRGSDGGGTGFPRAILVAFALLVLASLAAVLARAAEAPAAKRTIRVVYLAGASVYLDAGTSEGLASGDTLVVRHLGSEIAMIRVDDVSSHRSSCDTLLVRRDIQVGDEARVIGRAPRSDAAPAPELPLASASAGPDTSAGTESVAADSGEAATTTPASPAVATRRSRPWLRGRVGARWLSSSADGAVTVHQPMLDLRFDGGDSNTPLSTTVDIRGRSVVRTSSVGDSRHDTEARVYRAQLNFQAEDAPARVSVGRLTSPSLASVSLFDGALVESGRGRWRLGVFGGTQPEPERMGWSSRIVEYGGYTEVHQKDFPERRWQLGAGAVSSLDGGQPNRDFLFAQGFYRDARVSGSWLQEADVYRPERREPGKPGFSLTSTFLSAQARLFPALSLQGGYDNRRNVRLWRDRLTPETEFDDRYREGVWAGATARPVSWATFAGSQRWNHGAGERSTVTSANTDLIARRWFQVALRGRWSQYRSDVSRTSLFSGSVGGNPIPTTHVEVNAGRRQSRVEGFAADAPIAWWGADADFSFGRRWFGDVSFERSSGELEKSSQVYAGLSRRF